MSEEIITHSTLVGKLLVNQSIDLPIYTDKSESYSRQKEKTIRALSRSRKAAYASVVIKDKTYQLQNQAIEAQNTLRRVTPRPVALFFTFLAVLLSTTIENTGEGLHRLNRSFSRVRYGVSRRISCYCAPRAAGMLFLIVSVFMIASTSLVGVGLQVSINGKPVGFVSKRSEFTQVVSNVESKVSQILGYPYTLNTDVSYDIEMFNRKEILDLNTAEQMLFDGISEIKRAYVLTVDGEIIGANTDKGSIDKLLGGYLAKQSGGEKTDQVEFLRDVKVSLQYTDAKNVSSIDDLSKALSANVRDQKTYTVASGDVFGQIAEDNGLSTEMLAKMNPNVDVDHIKAGQVLIVEKAIPLMSIKMISTKVSEENVAHKTEYVNDNSLFVGSQKVKVKGVDGIQQVTTQIVRIDGEQQSSSVMQESTLSEPITEVIRVGTKKRAATGTYIIPYHGTISSRFGWRVFRGRYENHTGIDFAGPVGSPIVASDGGKVVKAGWNGSYGYCVIIDHGNGVQTLYGHCSKLLVKVGQKVAQGELIARVGSTGRSTGPHCHFGVSVNGRWVNPANYLW